MKISDDAHYFSPRPSRRARAAAVFQPSRLFRHFLDTPFLHFSPFAIISLSSSSIFARYCLAADAAACFRLALHAAAAACCCPAPEEARYAMPLLLSRVALAIPAAAQRCAG